jgi:formate hydrogenlyase subunit 3/multisubunit Na+/H+ antiporter MnhD subunit
MTPFLIALAVLGMGAFAALAFNSTPTRASLFGAAGAVIGGAIGLVGAVLALLDGREATLIFGQEVLFGGRLVAGIDPLSAFFLAPVFLLGILGAIYGRTYLLHYRAEKWLGPPWFSFNLLVASMAAVVLARDGLTFLVAWEAMSLSAYSLVSFEHEIPSSRRAGWIYLIASHVALALLIGMFLTVARSSVSLELATFSALPAGHSNTAILLLALGGFGIKAGLFPAHVWLPEAHAAAPSHVSAMMSGVLIKMGVYGLLRMIALIGHPSWWGPLLMILGIATGLVGIALALLQRDLKRALAYSSVENVGVVFLGLGLGLYAESRGDTAVAWLGFAGALFHVWNHALMKGLLFLVSGGILHAAGTKDIERLGGLLRRMPFTGALMIVGAVAISALPPLNGFASEWLIYLGLMRGAGSSITLLLSVGLLALIGCLASFCFIRLAGMVLLGEPRTEEASRAHEGPPSMVAPIAVLALISILFAVLPAIALAPIDGVIAQISGLPPAPSGSRLEAVGMLNGAVIALVFLTALALRALVRRGGSTTGPTWGCGYSAPTARMQYTGRSFSELLASRLIPGRMQPRVQQPSLSFTDVHGERTDAPLFPGKTTFTIEPGDPITRGVYEPFFSRWATRLSRMRWLQQGVLHIYIAYILAALIAALVWMSLRSVSP